MLNVQDKAKYVVRAVTYYTYMHQSHCCFSETIRSYIYIYQVNDDEVPLGWHDRDHVPTDNGMLR